MSTLLLLKLCDALRCAGWNDWNNGRNEGDYNCGGRRWDREGMFLYRTQDALG